MEESKKLNLKFLEIVLIKTILLQFMFKNIKYYFVTYVSIDISTYPFWCLDYISILIVKQDEVF